MILASGSPRRKELLHQLIDDFQVVVPEIDEGQFLDLPPHLVPGEISKAKARSVAKRFPNEEILACDTIVLLHDKVLGKPKDMEEAEAMLKEESGQTQTVLSGYTYIGKGIEITRTVATEVRFATLTPELIARYLQDKRPLDKAGSYGIQDGYPLVESIQGSYHNVVGLPLEDIAVHVFGKRLDGK